MQENLDIQRAIDAANSASLSARNTWLSYILVMAYMGVTLFSGLDPKSSVTLPILSVSFPASFYGVIAPFFFFNHASCGHDATCCPAPETGCL